MLKQCLLVLIMAGGGIPIAEPLAIAQDGRSNNQQSLQVNVDRSPGTADSARRTAELTKQLKLTTDQQTKVQGVFQSERSELEILQQDTSLSQEDRQSKTIEIHQNMDTAIRAMLDSNQRQKWDDLLTKRQLWTQIKHPE